MNVQALSDQVLLNHYLSGDQGAISKLIERHSRRVRDYINMMVKDRDVAEDIFQEKREVVMMRYFSGLSFKDIAEQTDVSINTALGRMRYALINLRRMIKEKNMVLC